MLAHTSHTQSRRCVTTQAQRKRTHDPPTYQIYDDEEFDQPVDMAYLKTREIPTAQDYPAYPPQLFSHKLIATELHNLCARSKVKYDINIVSLGGGNKFRCKIVIGLPNGGRLKAIGDGQGKVRSSTSKPHV